MVKRTVFLFVIVLWSSVVLASCKEVDSPAPPKNTNPKGELNKDLLPQPVYSENPAFVELYWKAWELAWGRVKHQSGVFQSPYMDEALWDDTIWIWDTAFMVLFCRYAPDVFPGIQSLNNFYQPLLNQKPTSLKIQHPDNPPLFAWAEYEYYKLTGDKEHVRRLIKDDQFLQRYYTWFDNLKRGSKLHFGHSWIALEKKEKGFVWGWTPSGMDNTPRGRGRKGELLWMDALAQQALSALYISKLADVVDDVSIAAKFRSLYLQNKRLLNDYYWDNKDGFYYDISEDDNSFVKVRTPTVYWAMLAEVADNSQAQQLVRYATDPNEFGGNYPWPSVSRTDLQYNHEIGDYWKGGVWLPHAYMSTKALEKYGYFDVAYENTQKLLTHMSDTYKQFSPHSIWECYAPSTARPSERQRGDKREFVAVDFCGWSALGPISMFIENIIGFHHIDASKGLVEWNKRGAGNQGIRNLRFGAIVTDIVANDNRVEVKSSGAYTLRINGTDFLIKEGLQVVQL